jgi:hypothetical protein
LEEAPFRAYGNFLAKRTASEVRRRSKQKASPTHQYEKRTDSKQSVKRTYQEPKIIKTSSMSKTVVIMTEKFDSPYWQYLLAGTDSLEVEQKIEFQLTFGYPNHFVCFQILILFSNRRG